MYATIGPSKAVAAADGTLVLLSHGKLHRFGKDGMRTEVIDLAALGVPVRPSDFAMHRDGRLLITDPDRSVLHRCVLPRGPCETLDVGLLTVPGQGVLPLNAAKLYVDDDAKRYYVSDNFGHRLLIADFDGRLVAKSRSGIVHHPNQLATRKPGQLTVVDTDDQRLVTFDVSGDKFGGILAQMDTSADGVAREERVLPFDSVAFEDGTTWVLIARGHMQDADIVEFDASGAATRRIALDDDSDPFDIERWRDRVWVSDATNYRFESVDRSGKRGSIEDRKFLDELEAQRRIPARWRLARTAAQAGEVIAPLLALLLVGWRARRR